MFGLHGLHVSVFFYGMIGEHGDLLIGTSSTSGLGIGSPFSRKKRPSCGTAHWHKWVINQ